MDRKYYTLKFFRGQKRDTELTQLSEEERDFEYRRLYIEESELDLHVAFSRGEASNIVSWAFIVLCGLGVMINVEFMIISLVMSFTFQLFCGFYTYRFRKSLNTTKTTLKLVDNVIKNTYGITPPTYL